VQGRTKNVRGRASFTTLPNLKESIANVHSKGNKEEWGSGLAQMLLEHLKCPGGAIFEALCPSLSGRHTPPNHNFTFL